MHGPVKWFDSKKGFGFIVGPQGKDVFVHFSVIEGEGFKSLRDGEEVEYEFREGEKGLLADSVKRINAAPTTIERVIREHVLAERGN